MDLKMPYFFFLINGVIFFCPASGGWEIQATFVVLF